MSMLARVPLRQLAARRFAAPSRGVHGGAQGDHIPFDYSNRTAFATKLSAYLITGFSIPFVAAVYQIRKSSA